MVMVKPAMTSLDVLADVRQSVDVPLAAYHVSGEYSMVQAAAAAGWIDGPAVASEQLITLKRAGADFILTYFAAEMANSSVADTVSLPRRTRNGSHTRPAGHSRWRRLTGPLVRLRRGDALHGRAGARALCRRCRGDAVHRPRPVLWRGAARPRAPGGPAAITRAAGLGTTFGTPTPGEVLLAEAICDRVPGCEQIRLVSSGTEAAMTAVRLARGITGRDRVVSSTAVTTAIPTGCWPAVGAAWPCSVFPDRSGSRRERWRTRSSRPTTSCPS